MLNNIVKYFLYGSISLTCFIILNFNMAVAQSENAFYSRIDAFDGFPEFQVSEITLGAGMKYEPDYIGSDDYKIRPKFALYMRVKGFLTLEDGGVAFDLFGLNDFEFGPVLHITEGRNANVNKALEGLSNISRSIDLGFFVKFTIADRFVGRIRYFNDVFSGDNGGALEFSVKSLLYNKDKMSITLNLASDLVDKRRATQFFGISETQALSSGLPQFHLGGGFQDFRTEIEGRYKFASNWSWNNYIRYTRLLGNIVNSPIINSVGTANQFIIGSYATYTFTFQ
ncbi:MAG: MipA/OmpV family protein [Emcibacter sp.]|nr:MipA/OmpV family protein [Emcibacter sp.]